MDDDFNDAISPIWTSMRKPPQQQRRPPGQIITSSPPPRVEPPRRILRNPEQSITCVIPTIPPRKMLLDRALSSVWRQTSPVDSIIVRSDLHHQGAWVNRQKAAQSVNTKWIAFLDDDDEWLPIHIEHLMYLAESTGADMTWGWFDVVGGIDPWPHYRGKQYDINNPTVVPITYLVKTELFLDSGGFKDDPNHFGAWDIQDQPVVDNIVRAGGILYAAPETTWLWHHDTPGGNTAGVPSRWED